VDVITSVMKFIEKNYSRNETNICKKGNKKAAPEPGAAFESM